MSDDLDEQQFGMREAALYGLTYPKLLRTQLERKTFECGVRHPPPISRWTFSISDALFLRLLNYVATIGPGFEPSRVVQHACTLLAYARAVWSGKEVGNLKIALGWETTIDGAQICKVEDLGEKWATGSDRWTRMLMVVPVGRIVQELREVIAETPHRVSMPMIHRDHGDH